VQLHRPEVCYYAGGFSIDLSKPVDIQLPHNEVIPARTVTASLGSRHENILYWTRIGNEFPQSQVTQRISMTKANLEGYLADGLLLRMSVLNPDNKASIAQMTSFIEDLLAHSGAGTRRLITGVA
jgi:EpsI family protein